MITSRRSFITGALGLIAAPAIVKIANIMPVRGTIMDANQLIFSASGTDHIGPFRYVTMRGPDGFVRFFDYGSTITMQAGDTFTLDMMRQGMGAVSFNHNEWQVIKDKHIFTLS